MSASVFTRRSLGSGVPPDEAARLEAVDDPGDVGGVAVERVCERAHGQRLVGVEPAEGVGLDVGQVELGEVRAVRSCVLRLREPEEELHASRATPYAGLGRDSHAGMILDDVDT